jgi:hypothetical protein
METLKKLVEVSCREELLANTLLQCNVIGQEGELINTPAQVARQV